MNLALAPIRNAEPVPRPPGVFTNKLCKFGSDALDAGLPSTLLGCPFFAGEPEKVRLLNRYIRDRFTGSWAPRLGRTHDERRVAEPLVASWDVAQIRPPAPSSLVQIAYNVRNFCDWWTSKKVEDDDWESRLDAALQSLIEEYATDMEDGLWSPSNTPLQTNTIRQRQSDAIQFLRWAKSQGMTPKFTLEVMYRSAAVSSWSGTKRSRTRHSYTVMRRPNPITIKFPTTKQAKEHVTQIADAACQLGAVLVYTLGLRASEAIRVPASAFLERVVWSGSQPHIIVKGKGGRIRNIEISKPLLESIRRFITFERSIRLASHGGSKNVEELLVRDDGKALSYRSFWRAYRTADRLSPHLGRHWYAVNYLLTAAARLKSEAAAEGRHISDLSAELELDLIRLQANLGHVSLDTTRAYLVCLSQQMLPIDLATAFQDILDGSDGR